MGLDLRLPIGLLFLSYGVILTGYGVLKPLEVLGINVNLIWGVVLAAFGAGMLLLARRSRRTR
jgi:hypothetical protein